MSIKIVSSPNVYLVGCQQINDAELDRFLADNEVSTWTTDAEQAGEKLVEVAGRVCYFSFAKPRPGGHKAYIDHILEVGHGSVTEHAVFNFIISGVSRSFTHELVRHRAGTGFSQLSQRFVDESDCSFVMPPLILESAGRATSGHFWGVSPDDDMNQALDKQIYIAWKESVEASQEAYKNLASLIQARMDRTGVVADKTLRRKIAREAARSVLPNATETKIFLTANVRALRHIFEMRGGQAADAEIRRVAVAMFEAVLPEAPDMFGDFEVSPSGTLSCKHHKI